MPVQNNGSCLMAYVPFVTIESHRSANVIIICDHATNTVPTAIASGSLGLPAYDMQRHIAYDVGAAGVANHLGILLDATVVCSNFSRLVIDPNRGQDDPTLVMRLYDGTLIPANRHLTNADTDKRLNLCYHPYHTELTRIISERNLPTIISMHSFTPQLHGRPSRPWEVSILSNDDRRLSNPLLKALYAQKNIITGDNVPYKGYLQGDTMDKHALKNGLLHTLIEIRNDLIKDKKGQEQWATRLAPVIKMTISQAKAKGI